MFCNRFGDDGLFVKTSIYSEWMKNVSQHAQFVPKLVNNAEKFYSEPPTTKPKPTVDGDAAFVQLKSDISVDPSNDPSDDEDDIPTYFNLDLDSNLENLVKAMASSNDLTFTESINTAVDAMNLPDADDTQFWKQIFTNENAFEAYLEIRGAFEDVLADPDATLQHLKDAHAKDVSTFNLFPKTSMYTVWITPIAGQKKPIPPATRAAPTKKNIQEAFVGIQIAFVIKENDEIWKFGPAYEQYVFENAAQIQTKSLPGYKTSKRAMRNSVRESGGDQVTVRNELHMIQAYFPKPTQQIKTPPSSPPGPDPKPDPPGPSQDSTNTLHSPR